MASAVNALNSVSSIQGLSALNKLIQDEIARAEAQRSAIPQDTVTLSQASRQALTANQPAVPNPAA